MIHAEHPVATPVAGRVLLTNLELGSEIERGEILVQLDAQCQKLELEEQRAKRASLMAQLDALRTEVAMREQAIFHDEQAGLAALGEARAHDRKAQATAELAKETAAHYARLDAGQTANLELRKAAAQARRSQAESDAARLAIERLSAVLETRKRDRRSEVERQQVEIAKTEGESRTIAATIKRLEHDIERRTIRAAVAGRIGKVNALRVGSVVKEGQVIAAIVPAGRLQVVADFPPAAVFGQIHRGQTARLRLDGFPWSQYGTVEATVTRVGSAVRNGRVQVELAVARGSNPMIRQQHGLPGTLEIEVERVAPVTLLLRAAGRRLARPTPVRFADVARIE